MFNRSALIFTLFVIALLITLQSVRAEDNIDQPKKTVKRQKVEQTITTTVIESDSESDEITSPSSPSFNGESSLSQLFGSKATSGTTGCKIEALTTEVTRQLKAECESWIKEQKKDLKDRYRASTCEASCNDCGMSLQRCTVQGTIRYAK